MRLRLVVLMAALAAALAAPAGAHAQGLDQTCELSATRFDPDTVNVLFPDQSAQYWSANYVAVPGTRIRIDGIFPHSRYTSWNVYDPVLRPFAKLSDYQLAPDPGSANPFLPGADRTTPVSERHYTMFITFSPTDNPGPNTIYVDPSQHPTGVFTLRVYEPDAGLDATGGVGLPQVTWEPTSSTGPPPTSSPCQTFEKPSSSALTQFYTGQSGPKGPPYPGRNPPVWHKFVNVCQSGADLLLDNDFGGQPPTATPNPCANFGSGGFLSNLDISYVYAFTSTGFGPLLVFHGRAPTFAATYPNAPVMPSGEQVRYWSFCQNDPRRPGEAEQRWQLHNRRLPASGLASGSRQRLHGDCDLDSVGAAARRRDDLPADAARLLVQAGDPERLLRIRAEADGPVLPGGSVLL